MSSSIFSCSKGAAYIGEYYEVRRYKQHHHLNIPHDGRCYPTTLDEIVEDINIICANAKERGYDNDEKWQIIKVEYTTVYDDHSVFCTHSETKRVVALYDNGVVTKF